MKKDRKTTLNSERRNFLRGSLVAGAGAAAAAVLPGAVIAAEPAASDEAKEQKGYRLTPHILEYYKTTAS